VKLISYQKTFAGRFECVAFVETTYLTLRHFGFVPKLKHIPSSLMVYCFKISIQILGLDNRRYSNLLIIHCKEKI